MKSNFLFSVAKFTLVTMRVTSMAMRENLKKTNVNILKSITKDLGIECNKKKDDLICDILANSTSTDALFPIVEVFSSSDPALTQFKEKLPPFNKIVISC